MQVLPKRSRFQRGARITPRSVTAAWRSLTTILLRPVRHLKFQPMAIHEIGVRHERLRESPAIQLDGPTGWKIDQAPGFLSKACCSVG